MRLIRYEKLNNLPCLISSSVKFSTDPKIEKKKKKKKKNLNIYSVNIKSAIHQTEHHQYSERKRIKLGLKKKKKID